ncbi:hypothetical protein EFY79_04640 [Hanamia caeni]|jgi:hypothetical protein|uniref:Uncharacterized protein n=1 Tax=Hanamia caeni TaxID=2294116 RepID=A0A3M9NMF0_9BACT|nr:hypothetical protein [Hanamia caeni]RNI38951.1 hypothetical protein EFY79_04640 [Hanamia caeni]
MNELLLQTIIEKLEALEIALLKKNDTPKEDVEQKNLVHQIKSFQSEFEGFKSQLTDNNGNINKLAQNISARDDAKQNKVMHIHHFHNRVWLTVSMYLVSLFLAYGWLNCHNEKKAFEANHFKHRYWKANGNKILLKITYETDSLYQVDKDKFEKEVLNREKKIAEREKMLRLADERKKKLK